MTEPVSIIVSVLALAVSVATAWLTLLRRGTIKMTQPSVIFFGPDGRPRQGKPLPKIYLRALLFATSKRGRIIESMYVSLTRNESYQNFNIWVHGDERLVRGSGLFVGESGVAANHHFLTPDDGNSFQFLAGRYHLHVRARLLGASTQITLFSQELDITPETAKALQEPRTGLYFDWGPDAARYLQHVDKRPPSPNAEKFLESLAMAGTRKSEPEST